jgi:hypothetical protein
MWAMIVKHGFSTEPQNRSIYSNFIPILFLPDFLNSENIYQPNHWKSTNQIFHPLFAINNAVFTA